MREICLSGAAEVFEGTCTDMPPTKNKSA